MKRQRKEMVKKEEKIAKSTEVKEYKRKWQGTGEREQIALDNTLVDAITEASLILRTVWFGGQAP
jgi:hypothetical protein